jgi:hypothetical protein
MHGISSVILILKFLKLQVLELLHYCGIEQNGVHLLLVSYCLILYILTNFSISTETYLSSSKQVGIIKIVNLSVHVPIQANIC